MIFKIRHKRLGSHTHLTVFAGEREGSLGNCGQLVMLNDEFDLFEAVLTAGATRIDAIDHLKVAVIFEDEEVSHGSE